MECRNHRGKDLSTPPSWAPQREALDPPTQARWTEPVWGWVTFSTTLMILPINSRFSPQTMKLPFQTWRLGKIHILLTIHDLQYWFLGKQRGGNWEISSFCWKSKTYGGGECVLYSFKDVRGKKSLGWRSQCCNVGHWLRNLSLRYVIKLQHWRSLHWIGNTSKVSFGISFFSNFCDTVDLYHHNGTENRNPVFI